MEHVRAAAAAHAAAKPALYVAGSSVVRLVGDRMVCNGSVDFVEAELAVEWVSGCAGEAVCSRSVFIASLSHIVVQVKERKRWWGIGWCAMAF
jgi:hypothetical protein